MATSGGQPNPDIEVGRRIEDTARLTRALFVVPALTAVVALTIPVADLRLEGDEDGARTLVGMVAEFDSLRSASGVQPLVVITLVTMLVVLLTGLVTAWGAGSQVGTGGRWQRVQPATIISVAAVVLVLLALPLAAVIDNADHVASTQGSPPFRPLLGGTGMLLLTAVVAGIVARVDRRVLG